MEILQLETFIALAREENMSNVARAMHTSQPQISKILASLESELGVTLFDRVGRGIQLNKHGRVFLQYAMESTSAIHSGRVAMQNLRNSNLGTVTILERAFYRPLMEVIKAFHKENPLVNFRFQSDPAMDDREHWPDIIQACSFDDTYSLQQRYPNHRNLFTEEYYLVLSDRIRRFPSDRTELSFSDVIDLPFAITGGIGVEVNTDYGIISRAVSPLGLMPHFAFAETDFTMKMYLIEHGIAIAVLPAICVEDARCLSPHARFFRISDTAVTRTYLVASKPRGLMSPLSCRFWDFMMDYLDRNPIAPSLLNQSYTEKGDAN